MINTLRALEKSGYIDQIILHTPNGEKGSLTNFNVTIQSFRETQPTRKTATDSVWGMDGEYDFSSPETYNRRTFDITFNIYAELGDREDQRDRLVDWLKSADCRDSNNPNAIYMSFSKKRNAKYKNIWVEIGSFTRESSPMGYYVSTLSVKITTDPRFEKDGVSRI